MPISDTSVTVMCLLFVLLIGFNQGVFAKSEQAPWDVSPPIISFDNIDDWQMKSLGGAQAALIECTAENIWTKDRGPWVHSSSAEFTGTQNFYHAMRLGEGTSQWRDSVGKLSYTGVDAGSSVELTPKSPVELPADFTSVAMWIYGNRPEYGGEFTVIPGTPCVRVAARLKGSDGRTKLVDLNSWAGHVNWAGWYLVRRYSKTGCDLKAPVYLDAIIVSNMSSDQERSLYFDAFYAYKDDMIPLEYEDINAKLLPFPTTEDTILPTTKSAYTNRVYNKDGTYIFESEAEDERIRYEYKPKTGTLSDIEVVVGNYSFIPTYQGGIEPILDGLPFKASDVSRAVKSELVSVEIAGNTVKTQFVYSRKDDRLTCSLTLQIKGKSLIVDIEAETAKAAGFSLGYAKDVTKAKAFTVPFIVFDVHQDPPHFLYTNGVYVSTLIDWYRSNASSLYGGTGKINGNVVQYNGGAEYAPTTEGWRNPVKERVYITVSSDFQEVLPNIPNPPSPVLDVTRSRLFLPGGVTTYSAVLESLQEVKQYGIDNLLIRTHEYTWRGHGEASLEGTHGPHTFTLEACVEKGGREALQSFVQEVRDLGYRIGLYSNYIDYVTCTEVFNPDFVMLDSDGNWNSTYIHAWTLKPLQAVKFEKEFAPRIKEIYRSNASYCDVHTVYPPWRKVDYDARVPGAAMFRTTYNAYGLLLLNEAQVYEGPVISEGRLRWMYAGLSDADYAHPTSDSFILDFNLLKLRELQTGYGGGTVSEVIAYGNNGIMTSTALYNASGWARIGGVASNYYMFDGIQRQYAGVKPDVIRYYDGEKFLDTKDAIPVGANENKQVFVRYENGLEIHANANSSKELVVEVNSQSYVLPPDGHIAYRYCSGEDDFLQFRALIDGRKVDYVDCDEYLYVNTYENKVDLPGISVNGHVVIHKKQNSLDITILPIGVSGSLTVDLVYLGYAWNSDDVTIIEVKENTESKDIDAKHIIDGTFAIKPSWNTHRYIILTQ